MFQEPLVLFAGLPVLGVLAFSLAKRLQRFRRLEKYLTAEPRDRFWPGERSQPNSKGIWYLRGGLLLVAGTSLICGMSGLRIGTREIPTYQTAAPLVVLMDVSQSMAVEDVSWGRLGSAKLLSRRISARVPGSSLALTIFARDTHTLLPPGKDQGLFNNYVDALQPDMLTNQGTALETVLDECAGMAELWTQGAKPIFLLMSDGEDVADPKRLQRAARSIRQHGGRLATVAFGTETGGIVPRHSGTPTLANQLFDEGWEDTPSQPISRANPTLLQSLAEEGGGRFASAANGNDVNALLSWIETSLGFGAGPGVEQEGVDRWRWLAGIALLTLLLETALRETLRSKEGGRQ